jgi:hypothetical protein
MVGHGGPTQRRGQRVALLPAAEEVAPAGDDQRRRLDPWQLGRKVGAHEFAERLPPDPGRHAETLGDEQIELRRGDRGGEGALLERPRQRRIDRIGEPRHGGLPERLHVGMTFEGGEAAQQHQPRHPLRPVERKPQRHQRAHGVADDHRRRQLQGVAERGDVTGQGRVAVVVGAARSAVAALRDRQHPHVGRQVGQERLERAPGVGDAVQQDHGRRVARPALGVLERHAGGEGEP